MSHATGPGEPYSPRAMHRRKARNVLPKWQVPPPAPRDQPITTVVGRTFEKNELNRQRGRSLWSRGYVTSDRSWRAVFPESYSSPLPKRASTAAMRLSRVKATTRVSPMLARNITIASTSTQGADRLRPSGLRWPFMRRLCKPLGMVSVPPSLLRAAGAVAWRRWPPGGRSRRPDTTYSRPGSRPASPPPDTGLELRPIRALLRAQRVRQPPAVLFFPAERSQGRSRAILR